MKRFNRSDNCHDNTESQSQLGKSRRTFLRMLGLGAASGAVNLYADKNDLADNLIKASNLAADKVELTIFRPQDFLELQLNFIGFKISPDKKSISRSGSNAWLTVYFPPQSIAEQAFEEKGNEEKGKPKKANFDAVAKDALNALAPENAVKPEKDFIDEALPNIPAKTYISGKSRLVFRIPANINQINLTAEDLLGWHKFNLVTNKRAASPCGMPAFNQLDNASSFDNSQIILSDGITKTNIKGGSQLVQANNNNLTHIKPVVKANTGDTAGVKKFNDQLLTKSIPIQIIKNGKDTTSQAQINQRLRGATKEEAKIITIQNLPAGAITTNDKGTSVVANLVFIKTPQPVNESETAIEMPYRLFLSPNEYAAWHHNHELKQKTVDTKSGEVKEKIFNENETKQLNPNALANQVTKLTETYALWHSQLTVLNSRNLKDCTDATKSIRTVRALWGGDINETQSLKPPRNKNNTLFDSQSNPITILKPNEEFTTSLYNDDRHCIVHESSNWGINNFKPVPIQVNNIMLSTLGGWLDVEMLVQRADLVKAGLTGSLNLLKWKHIATLARDHYVEVVYAGNVLPFGHEASLIRITQRKVKENGFAANYQRYFVAITEEEKKYNPRNTVNNFKSFNFSTIRIVTILTPDLDPPGKFCSELVDTDPTQQFIPFVGGKPIQFKIKGYDLEGNEVSFQMPLVFVSTDVINNPQFIPDFANIGKLRKEYNSGMNTHNVISLNNQKMALSRSITKGDTTFEVRALTFTCEGTLDESPGFRPRVDNLDIYISAVQNITGKNSPQNVTLVDDENKGTVFAELTSKMSVDFTGSANKTGGSLSPNFSVRCLSKLHGAIGSTVEEAKSNKFNPDTFFDSTAKLFGIIPLGKVIKSISDAGTVANNPEGGLTTAIPALKNIETSEAHITQYVWNAATLQQWATPTQVPLLKFTPHGETPGKLVVETTLYRYIDSAKPSLLLVNSLIEDFSIELAGIAAVNFNQVGFSTGNGAKVDVTVDLLKADPGHNKWPLEFLGNLSFVNDLQRYIPSDGFSDPPFLDVSTEGITTGYTLALPDIPLGLFSLRQLTLGATIKLPFNGSPISLGFNFCEKQQPFTLTVSGLGGGGFFAIEFNLNGLQKLEAALEFGAAASINLGVASGAVSIMAGIYFSTSVDGNTKNYTLEGYVRINGAVSVLGLITASIEFLLTLAAHTDSKKNKVDKLWGEATLSIKVEVFMFSKTVELETSREFPGAGADPTFAMMVSQSEWEKYCGAFAL